LFKILLVRHGLCKKQRKYKTICAERASTILRRIPVFSFGIKEESSALAAGIHLAAKFYSFTRSKVKPSLTPMALLCDLCQILRALENYNEYFHYNASVNYIKEKQEWRTNQQHENAANSTCREGCND
jgi:hypothetical protein